MAQEWKDHEPAPIEFMHSRMMELFHKYRRSQGDHSDVRMTGGDINNIIAQSKTETYKKYPKQVNNKAILKSII